ncbi:hypothetical protein AVEN_154807-1 [Araneus ventricosus]|uniref:Uncharacterized protein n=1 Tax=Araneus ventricosus TaxID=182803 RepID=A0A4Y2BVC6_ARAVE|nr:hypothetical protein AVEN_154807-1 [Araneus ventricosus]
MQLRKLFGSSAAILSKDTISLTVSSSTGTSSNSSKSHSTKLSGQSFFQAEMRVLLVTPHQEKPHFHVFSINFRQETMWKRHFRNSQRGFSSGEN